MDVAAWLRDLGLGQFASAFRESEIEADVLPELTEADLEKLGLPLGPRKRILKAIANLGECVRIDTPVGNIRGRARTGGIGMLSLTALIFSVMNEVRAAEFSSQRPLDSLDDATIKPKDLQLNGT